MRKTITISFLFVFFHIYSMGQVLHVDMDANGNDSGDSWLNAYNNLHLALENSTPGDTIWVSLGIYSPAVNHRDSSFLIEKSLFLFGGFSGNELSLKDRPINQWTSLSGEIGFQNTSEDNSYSIVRIQSDEPVYINGFSIDHGRAVNTGPYDQIKENGAGIFIGKNDSASGEVKIENCTFYNNYTQRQGGGIFTQIGFKSALSVVNCQFQDNYADEGSAVGIGEIGETFLIDSCYFSSNTYNLGCIYTEGSISSFKCDITNSIFEGNYSLNSNGPVFQFNRPKNYQDILVDNCDFIANVTGGLGSRLITINSLVTNSVTFILSNSTFIENSGEIWIGEYIDLAYVMGNFFAQNTESFYIRNRSDSLILYNNYYTHNDHGMHNGFGNALIANNTLVHNRLSNNSYVLGNCPNSLIYNNLFYDNLRNVPDTIEGELVTHAGLFYNSRYIPSTTIFKHNSFDNAFSADLYKLILMNTVEESDNEEFVLENTHTLIDDFYRINDCSRLTDSGIESPIHENAMDFFKQNRLVNGRVDRGAEESTYLFGLNTHQIDHICSDAQFGSIEIALKGEEPIVFEWLRDGIEYGSSLDSLVPGNYVIAIEDGNGCIDTQEFSIIKSLIDPYISSLSIVDPKCFGENTGIIQTEILGGITPYEIVWSDGNMSQNRDSLNAGDYSFSVTDSIGCFTQSSIIQIVNPDEIEVTQLNITNPMNLDDFGSIEIEIGGGSGPLSVLWSNMENSLLVDSLEIGDYYVTISDSNNCARTFGPFEIELMTLTQAESSELIRLFPNPFNQELNVLTTTEHPRFVMYRSDGSISLKGSIINNIIDTSSLKTGLYVLRLEMKNSILNYKVLKF